MSSRVGYNLLTKQGWKNLKTEGWRRAKYYFFQDTFYQILCWVVGHRKRKTDEGEWVCKRCGHYIKPIN